MINTPDIHFPAAPETSTLCLPNINTAQRRRRLAFGVLALAVGLGILAALMALGGDRWWRLPLLLVWWSAGLGYFQWRDRT